VTQPTERMVQGGGSTDGDDGNCSGSRCGIISSFPDPAPRQWAKEGDEGVLAPPNRVDAARERNLTGSPCFGGMDRFGGAVSRGKEEGEWHYLARRRV
jgi:hypothetical protein